MRIIRQTLADRFEKGHGEANPRLALLGGGDGTANGLLGFVGAKLDLRA